MKNPMLTELGFDMALKIRQLPPEQLAALEQEIRDDVPKSELSAVVEVLIDIMRKEGLVK